MRIPLDYYRILGLPIQATVEQLQQAHRDRTQQLPRREFSEAAITARKQLIDQSYGLLADPVCRQDYDTSFLAKSYDPLEASKVGDFLNGETSILLTDSAEGDPELGVDSYTPNIEIDETQWVGAMLILLELGEYELVLRLGHPYLDNGSLALKEGKLGDPDIVSADLILAVALAHLELGREQWQQGQYENAAISLESGQELLLREGLFPHIRGEMQSDLFKLRPYRVLELVSLPDSHESARHQGISLLEDMLHDRNGIDGAGDDLSGLSVDDFLRFIQQIRSYLTSAEQQALFEAEARRPSAVATYLAVYALLARGFAQRQPGLIRRAKLMLMRLGNHQDVHLEQAVCSLLLGQTEEASRALELSQEFESLSFIRDHSQGSPDLLPGLCLYSERWFQNEVFPHFRDLQQQQVSLTEYFADEEVQLYLEELTTEVEPSAWTATSPAASHITASYQGTQRSPVPLDPPRVSSRGFEEEYATRGTAATISAAQNTAQGATQNYTNHSTNHQTNQTETNSRTATVQPLGEKKVAAGRPKPTGRGNRPPQPGTQPLQEALRQPTAHPDNGTAPPVRRASGSQFSPRLDRILLLAALGLLGIMLLGFLFGKLLRPQPRTAAVDNSTANSTRTAEAGTGVGTGFAEFAAQQRRLVGAGAELTEENSPEVIQSWLSAKAAAMGENRQIDVLEKILVEPALTQQRARAEEYEAEGVYWKYEHSDVEIVSVETSGTDSEEEDLEGEASETENSIGLGLEPTADRSAANEDGEASEDAEDPEDPEESTADSTVDSAETTADADSEGQQATVEAVVREKAELFANGQLDEASSYDSSVRVRYNLVRQDGEWKIQSMEALD